jgi:hypothetical protein
MVQNLLIPYLLIWQMLYWGLLVHFRIDCKGYCDEISRKEFIFFFLIPFSWTVYSLIKWFKECLTD